MTMFWWQMESFLPKRNISGKAKVSKKNDVARIGVLHKKIKIMGDGIKVSHFICFLCCGMV